MTDLKKFRENVNRYRKRGYSSEGKKYTQKDLAEAMSLSAGELSHRLNGNGHIPFSPKNAFEIVLTLASWQTLRWEEAENLLALMDYPLDEPHWKTELQQFLTPPSVFSLVPPVAEVGQDRRDSNATSPAAKLILLTYHDFDHAHHTLYSSILDHQDVLAQSAYFSYIPNLIAAVGRLYRAIQPHWEWTEYGRTEMI